MKLYQIPSLKVLKKIKILTSYFWLKISKKPQLYGYTASFFKNFYLKNRVVALARLAKIFCYNFI